MKKLFNYALLAAALLVGVNVNAQNVAEVTMDGQTIGYTTLSAALQSIYDAAKIKDASEKTEATIKLLNDANLEWDANWMPGTSPKLELNEGEYIKIDMNGNNIDNAVRFNLHRAGIELAGKGNFNSTAAQTFNAYGDDQNVAAEYGYSKIIIGKDVTLTMLTHYALAIMNNGGKKNDKCFAAGVQVDVYGEVVSGYGISVSGNLQLTPSIEPTYTCPVIYIHKDARFIGGIYAAGYAIWNLEGYIEGATAVYAKSGVINVNGATLVGTGEYAEPKPNGNGADETGAAISLDTHGSYAGEIELHISGDATIKSENGNGIEEFVTKGTDNTGQPIDDHCESITITGGTIIGAEGKSSITTTEEIQENGVSIGGGTFNTDITEYLGDNNIVTPTIDDNGNTIYVIGTKDPDKDWKNDITTAEEGDYVKVPTGANQALTEDVKAEYLVQEGTATITVPEDVTLTVGEIVMSKDARIIVKPGAALVVKGDKGIVANNMENIVVETRSDKAGALLLDPNVTSNKNPKATVRFYSKAYGKSASDNLVQLFGCPMVQVDKIESSNNSYKTQFDVWRKNAWDKIGVLNGGGLDYSKFDLPFGLYCITSNNPSETLLHYDITGSLLGNSQPATLNLGNGYISIANSWTGMMDVKTIIDKLIAISKAGHDELQASIYVYTQSGTTLTWEGKNLVQLGEDIKPMEAIMILNEGNGFNSDLLSYKDLVFDPATKTEPVGAPTVQSWEKASIRIAAENQVSDRVVIAQGNQFSSDFENGYDAKKYMNEEVCVYVNADNKYDIYATDDVNNTFVGFNCKNAGKYTISFEDVTGDFALVDNKTNARIEMVEGNTYEFLAEAGEDAYRFQIVAGAKAPTDMQKTNAAVKATRALINGQIVISNGERFFNVLGAEVK